MNTASTISSDVIIVGAGAAGLMCAIESGKRGRSVLLLEHNDHIGKKIRISGGGRCNFTNRHTSERNFLSQNPHFAKSALARYRPENFCELVQRHQIPFHEKKLGQLFCDESSQNIIHLFKKECDRYQVRIILGIQVKQLVKKETFLLHTTQGTLQAHSLVIATGGLSIPPLGATDFGYQVARQFNLNVHACRPGLVPLIFKNQDRQIFKDLSGVSLEAIVGVAEIQFRENILFTHKGLSGPAILQISSYWQPGQPIVINLLPDQDILRVLKNHHSKKTTLKNVLKEYLPARLADILSSHFFQNKALNQYSLEELQSIADSLHHWEIIPQGTEGYAKAEVTVGGVDTNELSSKTMETKKVPGLYFIGEVVDVTGWLGGFNFQWAWASGYAAGQYV
jgi:predicted Rossmann fold flavoprotein